MSKKLYDIFIITMILFFLVIGIYHGLIMLVNSGWIKIDKSAIYITYNISYNLIIITLLYTIKKMVKIFGKVDKTIKLNTVIITLSIYPIIKLIINILCLFPSILVFVNSMVNFIGAGLIFLIVIILIVIKFVKN